MLPASLCLTSRQSRESEKQPAGLRRQPSGIGRGLDKGISDGQTGSFRIASENRPTRTLSKPDGICSSGVGQHLVKARHANLPYNALPFLVTYGVPSALSRRFADYSSK